MSAVGLDLSLTATGYADGEGARVITCKKYKGAERLSHFRNHLAYTFQDQEPGIVAVEGYAYDSHTAGSRSIGELGGVVRLLLWDMQIPWAEVPPTSLKKFATGKGNASKDQVLAAAVRLDPRIEDNNAADAFWLREMALYAKRHMGVGRASSTDYRDAAIKGVVWP